MGTPFTDTYVRNLAAAGRYTDSTTRGLNLQVKPNGGKYWTYRYYAQDRRYDLSLGAYPEVGLKLARARATEARVQVNRGQHPCPSWRKKSMVAASATQDQPAKIDKPNSVMFADYAESCIEAKRLEWRNAKHAEQWSATIKMYANPVIGNKPIDAVNMDDILEILEPIWREKTVTATRLRGRLEWILASATTRKLRSGPNPATWKGLLETILPKPGKIKNEQHHAAMPYKQVPSFIRLLQDRDGVAALALEFLILNANRTGEVIGGRRSEVSTTGIWTIPGGRMKSAKEHRIPLGQRSLELLQVATTLDPASEYLFSTAGKPISSMTMSMLLRRMGHKETVHGFRSSFRDWVSEETTYSTEVAEKALAHTIANKVESAYRRGDLLEPRRQLLLTWENYCLSSCVINARFDLNKEAA